MVDSECEENIELQELDEFEAYKYRATSPSRRMMMRHSPDPEVKGQRSPHDISPDSARGVPVSPRVRHRSPHRHDLIANEGDPETGEPREEDALLRKGPPTPSPKLGRPKLERQSNVIRLGRSYSCRPRVHPKKLGDVGQHFKGSRGRIQSLVNNLNDSKGRMNSLTGEFSDSRGRISSLVGEINDLTRHGSLTGSIKLEGGGEIYRVRSFTIHSKGFINRGDSFKIRSPSCRRSLIRKRQDSIVSLTGFPLRLGMDDEDEEELELSGVRRPGYLGQGQGK